MQRRTILIFLGALLIAGAIGVTAVVFLWRTAKQAVTATVLAPQEKTIDMATVVMQVRELNRLETASMHVVHIGTISQTYNMVPNSLGGDEITFLAAGDVIAGVDLSQLKQEDVWRSPDGTINLRLPRSQILVSRVDNGKSRVITRRTGMLRRADVDLETRARQHAETNIRAEAVKKGLLPLASQNAEKKLAELLHTFGAEKVRFIGGATESAPALR